MNYRIVNGAVSYGAETILEEIDIEIKEKDKVAIVGRNGAGKTTLLNAIINNDMLEEGIGEEKFNVFKQGNPVIGYLKQIEFNEKNTLLDEVLKAYKPIIELEERIKKLEEELKNNTDEKMIEAYTSARDRYELIGGYTYKKEYQTIIRKFGFTSTDEQKRISEFSGGQKTRIAFIKLLISKPDILLLDEPTNHLDIETIEWLESYLKNYPKAVVIVSHDRMFLNKIVNKVYEIEYATVTEYKGNYSAFELQKRMNYEKQLKDFEFQQKEIKRLTAIADRFRYKPTKAKMALSKLKQVERMVKVEEPNRYDMRTFHTNFTLKKESGKNVLSVKDLEIGYDNVLAKVSFDVLKGQKLAIIGANGIGKSTLLKTLMGKVKEISGKFEFGYNVEKEYFDQELAFSNSKNTIFDEFQSKFPALNDREVRSALASFLFTGEDVFKEIEVLSGGEKVRLKLCEIFKKGPNLMLLDEPTNHLDIIGKESLENILKEYEGTLIFVSHDRYFVNKIADSLLIFEKDKVTYFDGNYEEYSEKKAIEEQDVEEKVQVESKPKINEYFAKKEINKIKDRISKIEEEISSKENEVEMLNKEMLKEEVCSDYLELTKIQEKIKEVQDIIDKKMSKWEELNENLNSFNEKA
jgi:ATP-binding cassette subfamily F protein 3